jgi:alkylresorcinol/alkylpyrone synthase
MTARIQALGTAMPDHYVFKQSEIVEAFFAGQPGWDPAWAEVFANSGVDRRASVVDPGWYGARPRTTADRMREFVPAARKLGAEAAWRALERGGVGAAAEVSDLLAVSCTGYSGPGLDVHLADDLGLGDRVQRLAIGHMGCYAALPALRTAAALATASGGRALVTCVELCTLHTQPPRTREDAVYLALFGDGAAAALVGAGGDGPVIAGSATVTVPRSEERMGWLVEDEGFRMWLSPRVPALVERGVGGLVDELLRPHGLTAADVAHWAVHPGGPEIIDRVQRRLRLGDAQVARSREVLADGGNRSSATVLFILEQLLGGGEVEPGQWIVALAFGTGLTLEALLLQA